MAETIAQAVVQIKNTVSFSNLGESATKQGVVLKLLSLAGWNSFNISEVVPEYTVGKRRVDYALRIGSTNAVFIEVKKSGENLEKHQQQLLEYCFQEGVKLAALTNGQTWWLYLPLQTGSWEQRRFLTIDLESQAPDIVEQRFMEYLSQENVISGQAVSDAEDLVRSQQRAEVTSKTMVEAWNQIVGTPDELLVDLISETTERLCGFKPEPESVERFLSRHFVHAPSGTSSPAAEPSRRPPPTPEYTNTVVSPASTGAYTGVAEIRPTTGATAKSSATGPLKVQPLAQSLMRTLLDDYPDLLTDTDIHNLMSRDYCKNILGLQLGGYPLLRGIEAGRKGSANDRYNRYYVKVYAGKFYVCSQWWTKDHLSNARSLLRFITELAQRNQGHPGIPTLEGHVKAIGAYISESG